MQHQFHQRLLGVFCFCSLVSVVYAMPRQTISLDGVWRIRYGPRQSRREEKWYEPAAKLPTMPLAGYAPTADGTIRVPGIWDNQGYGRESEKLRHDFAGKGWYKRQIEIPRQWAGRRCFWWSAARAATPKRGSTINSWANTSAFCRTSSTISPNTSPRDKRPHLRSKSTRSSVGQSTPCSARRRRPIT